jgi:hypothetical protein
LKRPVSISEIFFFSLIRSVIETLYYIFHAFDSLASRFLFIFFNNTCLLVSNFIEWLVCIHMYLTKFPSDNCFEVFPRHFFLENYCIVIGGFLLPCFCMFLCYYITICVQVEPLPLPVCTADFVGKHTFLCVGPMMSLEQGSQALVWVGTVK